jgi:hypothetical protein
MYNLDEMELRQMQVAVLNHYKTTREDLYKPEMSVKDAIGIYNRIVGVNAENTIDKTETIANIEKRLVVANKLRMHKEMYRTA